MFVKKITIPEMTGIAINDALKKVFKASYYGEVCGEVKIIIHISVDEGMKKITKNGHSYKASVWDLVFIGHGDVSPNFELAPHSVYTEITLKSSAKTKRTKKTMEKIEKTLKRALS